MIVENAAVEPRWIDLASGEGSELEAKRLVREEISRPFNLSTDMLLWRAMVLKLADEEHLMVVTMHHIISDEWSLKIFFRELSEFYAAFLENRAAVLPELSIQYADYAIWQRGLLKGDVLENQLKYWREKLQGNPSAPELMTDHARTLTPSFRGRNLAQPLGKELSDSLRNLANREGVTLFMLLLAALKALLYRYTQQEDIIVGSPIAGRNQFETEGLVGFFVNTLALRTRVRNLTRRDYPRDKCVHELFEAQAGRLPDSVAVVFGNHSLSYSKLNERANQLAHFLKRFNVGKDVPVAICMKRSPDMVVGMLAILKAGGAYVPVDATCPNERLEFMLVDSQAPVLLTQQPLLRRLPRGIVKVLCLDTDWELIAREPRHNLPNSANAASLAYIMYTSGSTGRPKGVAAPHRAICRLVLNTDYVQLGSTDRLAQISNISFDAATFEIWGALLNGGQLVGIATDVALSPHDFAKEVRDRGITGMFLTSALFNQVAAEVPAAFSKRNRFSSASNLLV